MAITKCGIREVRSPCAKCGRRGGLYWGHDTDRLDRRGRTCSRCKSRQAWVLVDRTGRLHECEDKEEPKPPAPWDLVRSPAPTPETRVIDGTTWTRDKTRGNWYCTANVNKVHELQQIATWSAGLSGACDECMTVMSYGTPEHKPEAPATSDATDEKLKVLRDLFGGPSITQEDIDAMVHASLSGMDVSVRTVVEILRDEEPPIKFDGLTHYILPKLIKLLQAGQAGRRIHVMLVGPAGTGKTTLAEQAATALGLGFASISLSPQTPESKLLGFVDAQGREVMTLFADAYETGKVFLFDEGDNAHPSILAVINAALSNGSMAFGGRMVQRHPDFRCVLSANTFGRGASMLYVGRQPIDEATRDRFFILYVGIDKALEDSLCQASGYADWAKVVRVIRRLRDKAEAEKMQVIMGPRATMQACDALTAGLDWSDVVEGRLRRGLSDVDWNKLTGGTEPVLA